VSLEALSFCLRDRSDKPPQTRCQQWLFRPWTEQASQLSVREAPHLTQGITNLRSATDTILLSREHGEHGRVTFSVRASFLGIGSRAEGRAGLQLALGELRQVSHHAELVNVRVRDLFRGDNLIKENEYGVTRNGQQQRRKNTSKIPPAVDKSCDSLRPNVTHQQIRQGKRPA